MRKYQKLMLAISLALVVAHVADAAPRGRRRARRGKQNYSTTKYYSTNNRTYQQPVVASNYTVSPAATTLPNAQQRSNQGYVRVDAMESSGETVQRVTATSTTNVKPRTLDVGDSLPLDPLTKSSTSFAHTTYKVPVDGLQDPPVAVTSHTQVQPQIQASPAVFYTTANTAHAGGAMAEVNAIRARRGLRPFIEDASLSAVAYRKAAVQANRGSMGHPGGSMGGARFEGVGMGHSFISCYLYSNGGNYAGAASVRGRNGQRYHCLLVR